MSKNKKTPKRLLIDISDELHAIIKAHASFLGMSLKEWVHRAILNKYKEEENR